VKEGEWKGEDAEVRTVDESIRTKKGKHLLKCEVFNGISNTPTTHYWLWINCNCKNKNILITGGQWACKGLQKRNLSSFSAPWNVITYLTVAAATVELMNAAATVAVVVRKILNIPERVYCAIIWPLLTPNRHEIA
jgi:hypothetical protein